MPIENERKYVLKDAQKLYTALKAEGQVPVQIYQGYVNENTRVRKIIHAPNYIWMFSAKFPVQDEMVEIEKIISEDDFNKLWSISQPRLRKERFAYHIGDITWDIDFYIDGGTIYFGLAECEMPVNFEKPKEYFEKISQYVIYEVPKSEQSKYSAYRLADPMVGRQLMKELENA